MIFAFLDSLRHISLLGLILFTLLSLFAPVQNVNGPILFIFLLGSSIAFAARSAWFGWSQLERLHRNLKQEYYEIQHHRAQEKEELKAMYGLKGFQEPLLSQVVDVLMADDSRLLKVMIEEEMGLSLDSYEHPLRHALASFYGGILATALLFFSFIFLAPIYFIIFSFLIMVTASTIAAFKEKNKLIPAFIWSLGIAGLVFGLIYFIAQILIFYNTESPINEPITLSEISFLSP